MIALFFHRMQDGVTRRSAITLPWAKPWPFGARPVRALIRPRGSSPNPSDNPTRPVGVNGRSLDHGITRAICFSSRFGGRGSAASRIAASVRISARASTGGLVHISSSTCNSSVMPGSGSDSGALGLVMALPPGERRASRRAGVCAGPGAGYINTTQPGFDLWPNCPAFAGNAFMPPRGTAIAAKQLTEGDTVGLTGEVTMVHLCPSFHCGET